MAVATRSTRSRSSRAPVRRSEGTPTLTRRRGLRAGLGCGGGGWRWVRNVVLFVRYYSFAAREAS